MIECMVNKAIEQDIYIYILNWRIRKKSEKRELYKDLKAPADIKKYQNDLKPIWLRKYLTVIRMEGGKQEE